MPRRRGDARTIAVLNGKGGGSKIPTTAMLAAVFAGGGESGSRGTTTRRAGLLDGAPSTRRTKPTCVISCPRWID